MDSSTATMVITGVVAALVGALQGYAGNMQTATMWAGRAIAPADFGPTPSNGVQDAITPPWQTKLQVVWMAGLVVVLIGGSLQRWYFGIVALGIALVATTIARLLLPQRAAWYLYLIESSLAGRMADYSRDDDYMRAEVARDLLQRVSLLLDEANRSHWALPSFREARSTPFGQVDAAVPAPSPSSGWRPPDTFLDDGVPEGLQSSAKIALVELRDLGATDEQIREILSVPNGAAPLGFMQSKREHNPEWARGLSEEDRRQWIDGLLQLARDEGSRSAQG